MRVTNDQAKHNAIAEQIKAIGDKYKVKSYDCLFDLYNLFRNKGKCLDADPKTLEAMRRTDPARYWIERNQWHKQRVVFNDISKSLLYKALLSKPPLVALEEVCAMLSDMHARLTANKKSGPVRMPTMPAYNFYKNDYDAEQQEFVDQGKRAASNNGVTPFEVTDPIALMAMLFNDHNSIGAALFATCASPYLLTAKLDKPCAEAQWLIDTAKRYSKSGGAKFFQWIANLAGKAGFEEKKDLVTDNVTEHKKEETIEATSEVVNANPVDLQRPDLEKQIVDKTLVVTKNTASTLEKSHSVVLLDVSGSMSACDMAGGRCDRALYAFCVIFAMMQKVIDRGDVFHIILFEGSPQGCLSASNTKEAVDVINKMCHHSRWGGGTDIQAALLAGIEQVKAQSKYRHADIILLTDGESAVNTETVRKRLPPKTKIRGIHIGRCSPDAKQTMFDVCDQAVVAGWDDKNDMPLLDSVLKGV